MSNRLKNAMIAMASLVACVAAAPAMGGTDPLLLTCEATPSLNLKSTAPYPFGLTNNLRRREGSAVFAEGTPIIIRGKLTDANCLPVTGASIKIWHADSGGNAPDGKLVDKHFVGSGVSTTNNLGEFEFLTIKPGTKEGKPNVVHVIVRLDNEDVLTTDLSFGGPEEIKKIYPRITDSIASKLLIKEQKKVEEDETPVFIYNLTLDSQSPQRGY